MNGIIVKHVCFPVKCTDGVNKTKFPIKNIDGIIVEHACFLAKCIDSVIFHNQNL